MIRKSIFIAVGLALILAGAVASAADLEMKPFTWREDFEQGNPVEEWASNGEFKINFEGLVDDNPYSGEKYYKIDVTFESTKYVYRKIPLVFAGEGEAHFAGRLRLGEGNQGQAGLGFRVVAAPSTYSSCPNFGMLDTTDGKWELIEGDIPPVAKEKAEALAAKYLTPEDAPYVSPRVTWVGIFLRARPGQRVVACVDDLLIEGKVPTNEAFEKVIEERWTEGRKAAQARRKQLIADYAAHGRALEAMRSGALSDVAAEIARGIGAEIAALRGKMKSAAEGEAFPAGELSMLETQVGAIGRAIADLEAIANEAFDFKDSILFAIDNPIMGQMVLPRQRFVPGRVSKTIDMTLASDEYESVSVVVQALADLEGLTLEVGNLTREGGGGSIPAAAFDVKAVKCWYQAESAWVTFRQSGDERKLVPELLLNDDSLVRVDEAKKQNHVKCEFPDGAKYVWAGQPKWARKRNASIVEVAEFPVRDAKGLRPLDLPAGENKQYWITLRLPDGAKPGAYSGRIVARADGGPIGSIALRVRALPFALPRARTNHDPEQPYTSSVYYRAKLDAAHPRGSISSEWKSEEQLRAELIDMKRHNITNPTCYQRFEEDRALFEKYLRIRKELGMTDCDFYCLGNNVSRQASDEKLASLKDMIAMCRKYGFRDVYIYGADEARGARLLAQREAWSKAREVGVRMFTAAYSDAFEGIGDLLDTIVYHGEPPADEPAKWHSIGHQIFVYSNPQAGVENPEVYRRNFGLSLWKLNCDGNMTYAYQASFGFIYNDFDHERYREEVFAYPTVDGVIDTIALEGYREGIDDIRYATLLRSLIAKAIGGENDKEAKAATKFLNDLNTDGDLAAIRARMIEHILALQ